MPWSAFFKHAPPPRSTKMATRPIFFPLFVLLQFGSKMMRPSTVIFIQIQFNVIFISSKSRNIEVPDSFVSQNAPHCNRDDGVDSLGLANSISNNVLGIYVIFQSLKRWFEIFIFVRRNRIKICTVYFEPNHITTFLCFDYIGRYFFFDLAIYILCILSHSKLNYTHTPEMPLYPWAQATSDQWIHSTTAAPPTRTTNLQSWLFLSQSARQPEVYQQQAGT